MKRSITRTVFIDDLTKATIILHVYEGCKYTAQSEDDLGKVTEVRYTDVSSWDIIEGGIEADEIESMTDNDGIDEFHEYLILHFTDGTISSFRNSHVDMIIR